MARSGKHPKKNEQQQHPVHPSAIAGEIKSSLCVSEGKHQSIRLFAYRVWDQSGGSKAVKMAEKRGKSKCISNISLKNKS